MPGASRALTQHIQCTQRPGTRAGELSEKRQAEGFLVHHLARQRPSRPSLGWWNNQWDYRFRHLHQT